METRNVLKLPSKPVILSSSNVSREYKRLWVFADVKVDVYSQLHLVHTITSRLHGASENKSGGKANWGGQPPSVS
ncbi:hypothetical protein BgiBS90_024105 [Biomphalaria glabrata]|nr:hypothetical protein BgiBS90_024105 [Biomphalaria glabrata]